MASLTKKERTFIAVKPDGVQRHLIGEIIQRFERRGLKMVACTLIAPTKEMVLKQLESYGITADKLYTGYREFGE